MATVVTHADGVSVLDVDQEVSFFNMDFVTHVHKCAWNNWFLQGFYNGQHVEFYTAGLPECLWWVKTLIKQDEKNAYSRPTMVYIKL